MGIAWDFRTQNLSSLLFSQPLSQKGLEFVWDFGWYCNNKNKYYEEVINPTCVCRMRSWEIGRFLARNKQTKQNTINLGAFCLQRRKKKRRRKGRERKRKPFPSLFSSLFNFSLVSLPGSFYFGTVQMSPSSGRSVYARDYQEFFFFLPCIPFLRLPLTSL